MSQKLKEILGSLFVLIIFGAVFSVSVSMYVDSFIASERKPSEQYVLEKQSKKSLFFGPRYQMITDYDRSPSFVTKKEFESIHPGDKIKGHMTNSQHFFTKMDDFYEGSLSIVLILVIGTFFIFGLLGFIFSIPYVEKKSIERDQRRKGKKKRKKKGKLEFWMVLLGVCIAIGFVYNTLYTINFLHKLIPIGQAKVEAEIIDRESDINITSKGNYSTHYLTVRFTAEDGQSYRVQKEVTGSTYNQWVYNSTIDIRYRNKNPYDIFIPITSAYEMISVLLHRWTFIYGLVLFIIFGSLSSCLKALPTWRYRRKKRRQERERQQEKQRRQDYYRRLRQQKREKKRSK